MWVLNTQAQVVLIIGGINNSRIPNRSVVIPAPINTGSFTPIATTNVARFYQNLTESYDSTHYNSFATSYSSGNKRSIVFRKGSSHIYDGNSKMTELYTTNGGYTWTEKELKGTPTFDIRNYGGGNTRAGKIFLFYQRWKSDLTWAGHRFITSSDGGNTFTGGDVNLPDPCPSCGSSPYGKMEEDEFGNLYQSFYLVDSVGKSNCYLWRSIDNGTTWNVYSQISNGTVNASETDIAYLGNCKFMAMGRVGISDVIKKAKVSISNDYGQTWSTLGFFTGYNGFSYGGVSPLIHKMTDSTVFFIATDRSSQNYFSYEQLKFGDTVAFALPRMSPIARPAMDANSIDFAYPTLLKFNNKLDSNTLISYYQTSTHWTYTQPANPHITDIIVDMAFRDSITRLSVLAINSNYPPGGGIFSPDNSSANELSCFDKFTGRRLVIRKSGSYAFDVQAAFGSAASTGTFRTARVEIFNDAGSKVGNFGTDIDFFNTATINQTLTGTLLAGQFLYLRFINDGSTTLVGSTTVTLRRLQ